MDRCKAALTLRIRSRRPRGPLMAGPWTEYCARFFSPAGQARQQVRKSRVRASWLRGRAAGGAHLAGSKAGTLKVRASLAVDGPALPIWASTAILHSASLANEAFVAELGRLGVDSRRISLKKAHLKHLSAMDSTLLTSLLVASGPDGKGAKVTLGTPRAAKVTLATGSARGSSP